MRSLIRLHSSSFSRQWKWIRSYHEISFQSTGDPLEVLHYRRDGTSPPTPPDDDNLAHVEMLYVPWNPADRNTVQGKYPTADASSIPFRQSFRFADCTVAGSEGLGRVLHVPPTSESSLSVGSIVAIGQPGLGTMRSTLCLPVDALVPLDRGDELLDQLGAQAGTLVQLGGTALRMLQDFVELEPGDWLIQNAGNSAVGWMLSQLAAIRHNVSVLSLLRRGSRTTEQFEQLQQHLLTEGKNSLVVAEEDLKNKDFLKDLKSSMTGGPVRLALNAVGGESAAHLLRMLNPGGTMVTYGGMSQKPVAVATPQLIFKDLRILGYWHSRWMVQNKAKRKDMMDGLVNDVLEGSLKCPPVQAFFFSQIQEGLQFEAAQSDQLIRKKVVFDAAMPN